MKRFLVFIALAAFIAAPGTGFAQPPKPAYVTGSPTTGALAKASGPQSVTTGDLSGDCTTSGTLSLTCTPLLHASSNLSDLGSASTARTNLGLGTFATQNYATPPAIGGTTPAAGSFTTLSATGNLTTNITGSTQCVQVNSSGVVSGAGAACGSGGGGTSSGCVPLEAHTASNSASLNFTAWYSSSYDEYEIHYAGVVPASNAILEMLVSSNGGSTWDTTSGHYVNTTFRYNGAGSALGNATSTRFDISESSDTVHTSTSYGVTGRSILFMPASTTPFPQIITRVQYLTIGSLFQVGDFSGWYKGGAAITAIQFIESTGNITAGTIRICGVTH